MLFDSAEAFVADNVLYFARILSGGLGTDTEASEERGENYVPLVNALGNRSALIGKTYVRLFIHGDVSVALKYAESAADRGLGIAHAFHYIDRVKLLGGF